MKKSIRASGKTARYLRRIYSHSGIETRYSVIRDFAPDAPRTPYFTTGSDGSLNTPDTRMRNDINNSESRRMFADLARRAIENCPGARVADITHVITASCKGFYSPGPDYFIARELGLAANVWRFHVGFMGCQAAFPALKIATALCQADPNAVALIVCVELCSLHLQFTDLNDSILAGAIF
jgi:predicted naringenin-chalcone synthase